MMISEFIEITGFEPTAEEYEEIEIAYMAAPENVSKYKFCSDWVKAGGIQRLARERVRKIEKLEKMLIGKDNLLKLKEESIQRAHKTNGNLKCDLDEAVQEAESWRIRFRELESQMIKVKEAFQILNGVA